LKKAAPPSGNGDSSIASHPRVKDTLELSLNLFVREEIGPKIGDSQVQFVAVLETQGQRQRQFGLRGKRPAHLHWRVFDYPSEAVAIRKSLEQRFGF
jgi:hypothetical protein